MVKSREQMRRERRKGRVNRTRDNVVDVSKLPPHVAMYWPTVATEVSLRILPYIVTNPKDIQSVPVGETNDTCAYRVHKNVGPQKQMVLCPTTFGRKCPICEEYDRWDKAGNKDRAKLYRSQEFRMVNVYMQIPDGKGGITKGFYIIKAAAFTFMEQLEKALKSKVNLVSQNPGNYPKIKDPDEIYDWDDPKLGYWIKVEFGMISVATGGRPFMGVANVNFDPQVKAPITEAVAAKAVKLDELLTEPLGYTALKALMLGLTEEEYHAAESEGTLPTADDIPMGSSDGIGDDDGIGGNPDDIPMEDGLTGGIGEDSIGDVSGSTAEEGSTATDGDLSDPDDNSASINEAEAKKQATAKKQAVNQKQAAAAVPPGTTRKRADVKPEGKPDVPPAKSEDGGDGDDFGDFDPDADDSL